MPQKLTQEEFIEKAKQAHGNKYDYGKVEYVNNHTKVCIICHEKDEFGVEHGEFWQKPSHHISGFGCSKCSKNHKLTTEEFIQEAKKIHGDTYDYSKTIYKNNHTKIKIICPIHGEFEQTPRQHLKGCGCPRCAGKLLLNEDFISRAIKVHGNKYDYSKVEYIDNTTKVCIICPEHGEFWQTPHEHLDRCGCQKCGFVKSDAENEIYKFLCENIPSNKVIQHERNVINPYELDIYIPELKYAIEYNGIFWHTEKNGKNKNYHLNKLKKCQKNNIKLIQIFEDEFTQNKILVLEKLKHIFNIHPEYKLKISGRKVQINEIDKNTTETFLNNNHIQGFTNSTIYLGAFYEDNLVAVMSFKENDKNSHKWELTRFASDYHYICQGVGGKLFKCFLRKFDPNEVKSFADRRWTVDEKNNIYTKLGFRFNKYTYPDYRYFKSGDGIIRQHKFGFRKNILHKKYGLPLTMTEDEMTKQLGYTKIWDCGLIKYVWKKETTRV